MSKRKNQRSETAVSASNQAAVVSRSSKSPVVKAQSQSKTVPAVDATARVSAASKSATGSAKTSIPSARVTRAVKKSPEIHVFRSSERGKGNIEQYNLKDAKRNSLTAAQMFGGAVRSAKKSNVKIKDAVAKNFKSRPSVATAKQSTSTQRGGATSGAARGRTADVKRAPTSRGASRAVAIPKVANIEIGEKKSNPVEVASVVSDQRSVEIQSEAENSGVSVDSSSIAMSDSMPSDVSPSALFEDSSVTDSDLSAGDIDELIGEVEKMESDDKAIESAAIGIDKEVASDAAVEGSGENIDTVSETPLETNQAVIDSELDGAPVPAAKVLSSEVDVQEPVVEVDGLDDALTPTVAEPITNVQNKVLEEAEVVETSDVKQEEAITVLPPDSLDDLIKQVDGKKTMVVNPVTPVVEPVAEVKKEEVLEEVPEELEPSNTEAAQQVRDAREAAREVAAKAESVVSEAPVSGAAVGNEALELGGDIMFGDDKDVIATVQPVNMATNGLEATPTLPVVEPVTAQNVEKEEPMEVLEDVPEELEPSNTEEAERMRAVREEANEVAKKDEIEGPIAFNPDSDQDVFGKEAEESNEDSVIESPAAESVVSEAPVSGAAVGNEALELGDIMFGDDKDVIATVQPANMTSGLDAASADDVALEFISTKPLIVADQPVNMATNGLEAASVEDVVLELDDDEIELDDDEVELDDDGLESEFKTTLPLEKVPELVTNPTKDDAKSSMVSEATVVHTGGYDPVGFAADAPAVLGNGGYGTDEELEAMNKSAEELASKAPKVSGEVRTSMLDKFLSVFKAKPAAQDTKAVPEVAPISAPEKGGQPYDGGYGVVSSADAKEGNSSDHGGEGTLSSDARLSPESLKEFRDVMQTLTSYGVKPADGASVVPTNVAKGKGNNSMEIS